MKKYLIEIICAVLLTQVLLSTITVILASTATTGIKTSMIVFVIVSFGALITGQEE
jgi:hypothetical protein|nr:MAG TPA_asm: hypothetical protein [Caudoviricetes sp.]